MVEPATYPRSISLTSALRHVLLVGVTLLSGCAVLFGNVQPVETQAFNSSGIPRLQKPWREISAGGSLPDLGYQHETSGSTLALTSGCRPDYALGDRESLLHKLANAMGSGLGRIEARQKRDVLLDGLPAVEMRLKGSVEGRNIILQSVVTLKGSCVYDVTLVSLERFFDDDVRSLASWIDGIRLP